MHEFSTNDAFGDREDREHARRVSAGRVLSFADFEKMVAAGVNFHAREFVCIFTH